MIFLFVFSQPALGLKLERVFIIFSSQCSAEEFHEYDGLSEILYTEQCSQRKYRISDIIFHANSTSKRLSPILFRFLPFAKLLAESL